MEKLSITVKIAERTFRLKVSPDEEERIRTAAKLINEKIKDYSNSYAYHDMQDLLSMVVLQFAVKTVQCEEKLSAVDDFWGERLEAIDKILSDHTQ